MIFLITGTSKGIGNALVKYCGQKGHTIVAVSRGDQTTIEQKAEGLYKVCFDWNDFDGLSQKLALQLKSRTIDVVINNAGILTKAHLFDVSSDELEQMYRVNAGYPLYMTRSLLKHELLSVHAHVINISSMGGFQGASKYPGLGGYSMSKAALVALTECMAAEWGDKITANCLCLGAVNTEMLRAAFPDYISEVSDENMASLIHDFALSARGIMSGKVIPVANSNP